MTTVDLKLLIMSHVLEYEVENPAELMEEIYSWVTKECVMKEAEVHKLTEVLN